jgi:hypothetical protein
LAHGGPVRTRRGPGERGSWAEAGDVVDGSSGEAEEGVEAETDRGGDTFDLAEQGDHVIGGDARSGVVGDATSVVHLDDPTAERGGYPSRQRVAVHRERGAVQQALGSDLGVGQWHERVERRPARMHPEDVKAE